MVRNEADVIELWARYNLRVLDHLHVVDHGSQDNTAAVIAQLQAFMRPPFVPALTT
jgi:glycosyltransferase involved in cell wall biosynthesis